LKRGEKKYREKSGRDGEVMDLDEAMVKFLKGDIVRDIVAYDSNSGKAIRRKIKDKGEYLNFIREHNGKNNIAVQVHSDLNIFYGLYNTLFLDFDGKGDIRDVLDEAKQMYSVLGGGRLYFSGRKGFHLYLDLEPVYLGGIYSSVLNEWVKQFKTKYLDLKSLKDKRRMARVVYTKHAKSGLYMIPIDTSDNVAGIISKAMDPSKVAYSYTIKENASVSSELRNIYASVKESEKKITQILVKPIRITETEMPPCVRVNIETLKKTGELDHYARFHIVNYLLQMGIPEGEVEKLFAKYAKDYDPSKTEYQVEYLKQRDMKPFNCKNAIAMGICPLEMPELCPYYPSIWAILKFMRE
jgi:DNA primase large subunit